MTGAPGGAAGLAGLRVVVTRPRDQAPELTRLLQEAGAEVLEIPTIELVDPEDWGPADAALDRLGSYRMAIFTSANGVDRFLARMERRGIDASPLGAMILAAIGPKTAAALTERGFEVASVPEEFRAEGVLEEVSRLLAPAAGGAPGRVLLPRAQEARDVLPRGLAGMGIDVDVVPVYRAIAPPEAAESVRRALREGVGLLTFTSSSTVRNFVEMAGEGLPRGTGAPKVACIGPITARTARDAGLPVDILPAEYTVPALFAAILDAYRPR